MYYINARNYFIEYLDHEIKQKLLSKFDTIKNLYY